MDWASRLMTTLTRHRATSFLEWSVGFCAKIFHLKIFHDPANSGVARNFCAELFLFNCQVWGDSVDYKDCFDEKMKTFLNFHLVTHWSPWVLKEIYVSLNINSITCTHETRWWPGLVEMMQDLITKAFQCHGQAGYTSEYSKFPLGGEFKETLTKIDLFLYFLDKFHRIFSHIYT